MSAETTKWLNENVLRGFTAKRGKAWHYSAAHQGDEPNHYDGAIPVADLHRRLFDWEAQPRPLYMPASGIVNTEEISVNWGDDEPNKADVPMIEIPGSVAWVRSDNNAVLGIHSDKYAGHQYGEWLVNNVETMVDGDLSIASAGLLKNGAIAWVQIETPENIVAAGGVTIRPFIMATTSFDGSIATTYKQGYTDVVCDNTRSAFLSESSPTFRIKHTRNGSFKALEARDALKIIFAETEEFMAEIEALINTDVSDKQWSAFVETHVPIAEDAKGRALTMAERLRSELTEVYRTDSRVSPWAGSAWGVIQATNTYAHHYSAIRKNTNRVEKNMLRAVKGEIAALDYAALTSLESVLGHKVTVNA